MSATRDEHPEPEPAPRRWWLWIILLAVVLGIAGIIGRGIYTSQFTLTRERLDAARDRWDNARIRDYDIDIDVAGGTSGHYVVLVRGGKVTAATRDGLPFEVLGQAAYWTVPGLFGILDRDLDNDAKPDSPVTYTQAHFDPSDGHLIRYTRSNMRQKVVIDVRLTIP